MKKGDRVKMKSYYPGPGDDKPFQFGTIIGLDNECVEIKIEGVEGYFIFSKDIVIEVIDESR